MTTDSASGEFGQLIEQARTGNLSLKADPSAFITLDKACQSRMNEIREIQRTVRRIYEAETWGIGEQSAVLTSAQTLVKRLREKAMTGPNNAFDTLEGHWQVANDLQTLFRTIRERYEETDAAFAARFNELKLAQRPEFGGGR